MSFQFSKHIQPEAARRGIPRAVVEAVLAWGQDRFLLCLRFIGLFGLELFETPDTAPARSH